jgi:hypothetical protein
MLKQFWLADMLICASPDTPFDASPDIALTTPCKNWLAAPPTRQQPTGKFSA